MKTLTIGIPTRNRYKSLCRLLSTIPDHDWIQIYVCCDADRQTCVDLMVGWEEKINLLLLTQERMDLVYCANLMSPHAEDGFLIVNDDCEFPPGSIENAREIFNIRFPDDDGVIGFTTINIPSAHPTSIPLLGKRFLDRLPNRMIWPPCYTHFADFETYRFAQHIGKFMLAASAEIVHYHPSVTLEKPDRTYIEGRQMKNIDFQIKEEWEESGRYWGEE